METNVIQILKNEQIEPAIDQIVSVLHRGGLVGFPTETVYGLAANANIIESIERLSTVKK